MTEDRNVAQGAGFGEAPPALAALPELGEAFLFDSGQDFPVRALPQALSDKKRPLLPKLADLTVTLLFLGPATALLYWLVHASAAFLGQAPFGGGLAPEWGDYALRVSLGVLLPPALAAACGNTPLLSARLLEAGRAAIIAFFFHTVAFLTLGSLIRLRAGSPGMLLLPRILGSFGPLAMCALFYVSFRLSLWLMPQPVRTKTAPAPLGMFSLLAGLLLLTALAQAFVPALSPRPPLGAGLYNFRSPIQDIFLFAALPRGIRTTGRSMFRPAFLLACLFGPWAGLLDFALYPPLGQAFHAARGLTALLACALLYSPKISRWLA